MNRASAEPEDALETFRLAVAATKSFDFAGGGLGYFDVRLIEIYDRTISS